jgi:hypothetical protein
VYITPFGRPAGRAARVVDRDRVVLGLEPVLGLSVAGAREELLVALADDQHPLDRRAFDEMRKRRVDDDDAGARMLEDLRDLVGEQPRVDRDQDGARRGDAEVRLEQLGRVERQEGDAIARLDSRVLKRHREPPRPLAQLGPRELPILVDDGDRVREHGRRPLQEGKRGQRRQVHLLSDAVP